MSDKVDADKIEQIVGVERKMAEHWGKVISSEGRVYILHSRMCQKHYSDLRDCPYSRALDRGIDIDEWVVDEPTALCITIEGWLVQG